MSESTAPPSAAAESPVAHPEPRTHATAQAAPAAANTAAEPTELSIKSLLEAGAHFGHLTRRWNPQMRHYIYGTRNGTHILDLDQTLPLFRRGLDFIRETTASGGHVLFVATKRQAASIMQVEAERARQYYVNNRWLGGMLTNWKTVKKSIETFKSQLEILNDEERRAAHSKKELARIGRLCDKYKKSLDGIKDMQRVPDALFVIDVGREEIAVSEARRLSIPIVAIVDSNCSPVGIDYVVPGNDDATRAIELYCRCVADACLEGAAIHQEQLLQQRRDEPESDRPKLAGGRRVVEIKQAPRRGRGTQGGTHSSGGWADKRKAEEAPAAAPAAEAAPAPAPADSGGAPSGGQ